MNLSVMKFLTLPLLALITASNLFGQFHNVQLPKPNKAVYHYSQVEPAIYINPANNDEVIAGSVMNDYYYSKDAGLTWKAKSIYGKYGVNGDPCMLIDNKGNYYYFHLSNIGGQAMIGGIVCHKSKSIKGKFKQESHTEVNGKFHDKEWVALNTKTNTIYMTWTQFDAYDSDKPEDESHIVFSKSMDEGDSWTKPLKISKFPGDCKDDDKTAEGAVPAVGPNGEIYVSWSRNDSLWFNVSLDDGITWMQEEKFITMQPNGWVIDIPGIYRSNGLPILTCDISNSEHHGTIYVNWADQRNGADDTDIWVIKSTDNGKNWSSPIRVNDDKTTHHQFLTWMTIDQHTGYLYFVFYDRRNHKNNETDVYLAVSKNGGETFSNYKISESPFLPTPKMFFGDYTNIAVQNGMIRPIWTRLHEGKITLHTAIINQSELN